METLPQSGHWGGIPRQFHPLPPSAAARPAPTPAFYPPACERPASSYRPRWG